MAPRRRERPASSSECLELGKELDRSNFQDRGLRPVGNTMTCPRISLVVALARNGVIGRDNGLAWHLRSDLQRFKALTMGKPMLMGRRTFDSIGKALPGRRSLVLTRDRGFTAPGVTIVHGWEEALAAAEGPELMVVGGADIFSLALPHADRIHLTEVDAAPEGDVVFPDFDRSAFRETLREAHPAGEHDEHAFTFIDLERQDSERIARRSGA